MQRMVQQVPERNDIITFRAYGIKSKHGGILKWEMNPETTQIMTQKVRYSKCNWHCTSRRLACLCNQRTRFNVLLSVSFERVYLPFGCTICKWTAMSC
jgi:hypothetical protein